MTVGKKVESKKVMAVIINCKNDDGCNLAGSRALLTSARKQHHRQRLVGAS